MISNVFILTSTGDKLYDVMRTNPKVDSKVVYMSPGRAIKKMLRGQNSTLAFALKRRDGYQNKVDQYCKDMLAGVKFNVPVICYNNGQFLQDGYHRLLAAQQLGMKTVPVLIIVH